MEGYAGQLVGNVQHWLILDKDTVLRGILCFMTSRGGRRGGGGTQSGLAGAQRALDDLTDVIPKQKGRLHIREHSGIIKISIVGGSLVAH